ncbi:MAG TPA: class I SAM-dependent methyltransferase [Candidatus Polarisedimenticolia bacterium]|nr:class I SAM-dependent methyltransferase [Candidatus Polarisedimenticolia bacterium]
MADPCPVEPPAPRSPEPPEARPADPRTPRPSYAEPATHGEPATRASEAPVTRSSGPPPCPVCRGTAWSARRSYTALRNCGDCGTVLNDRSSSRTEEEARYRDTGLPLEGIDQTIAARRWRFTVRWAGGTPHRVLDVGCGAGAFLEAAHGDGAEVAGIEIDPAAANAARSRGVSVTIGSILSPVPLGYGWDVVTLWDVLDHLDDPAEALARLRPRMKPGGLLVARGRNATLHAPLKRLTLLLRPWLPFVPDPAVVHRFGLRPEGWARLLAQAGFEQVRWHPAHIGGLLPSVLLTARAPHAAPPAAWAGAAAAAARGEAAPGAGRNVPDRSDEY